MTCAASSFQQQQDQTRQTHLPDDDGGDGDGDGDDDDDDDDDDDLHKEVGDCNVSLFFKITKPHVKKLLIEISLINFVFVISRSYFLT